MVLLGLIELLLSIILSMAGQLALGQTKSVIFSCVKLTKRNIFQGIKIDKEKILCDWKKNVKLESLSKEHIVIHRAHLNAVEVGNYFFHGMLVVVRPVWILLGPDSCYCERSKHVRTIILCIKTRRELKKYFFIQSIFTTLEKLDKQ